MEHEIEVEPDGRFTVTTGGSGSAEGIIAFLDAIVSHPLWQSGNTILLDHRKPGFTVPWTTPACGCASSP